MPIKNIISAALISASVLLSLTANADGIPVIDSANLANTFQNLVRWGQQLSAMQGQLDQQIAQYKSLNGSRNIGSLANNQTIRNYLPENYQDILNNGYGSAAVIRQATKIVNLEDLGIDSSSAAAVAFESRAQQIAINRATFEAGYAQAANRFNEIQILLNHINQSPDAKDIADLQARIQAEQVMLQNEANKLTMLSQLAKAQQDIERQRNREINLNVYEMRSNLGYLK